MYRLVVAALFLLMLSSHPAALVAKPHRPQSRVQALQSRPDLGLPIKSAAELKIASRKSTFQAGELITIDLAILNASTEPAYFRELSNATISVRKANGGPNLVQLYGVADRTTLPDSFIRLPPNEFLDYSIQLLAGCDERAFKQMAAPDPDSLTIFKQNLFLNWGNACFHLREPGTYVITAEMRNDYVVVSPQRSKIKTAVGKIDSNPLEITIVD